MFYVYEHWRPDLDLPFYVGKGSGLRCDPARTRNVHHTRIKKKLRSLGMCVEVRMVAHGLTEEAALQLEIERIAFWKANGVYLTNATAGGDGLKSPSVEVIEKMKKAAQKRWSNQENRKIHAQKTLEGMMNEEVLFKVGSAWRGKKFSEEHRLNISKGLKGKKKSPEHVAQLMGEKNPFFGKKHPPHILNQIAEKKRGSKMSEQTKAKMKESQRLRRIREKEAA